MRPSREALAQASEGRPQLDVDRLGDGRDALNTGGVIAVTQAMLPMLREVPSGDAGSDLRHKRQNKRPAQPYAANVNVT